MKVSHAAESTPKAEALLQRAHEALNGLVAASARLRQQGVAGDHLPGQPALMAMALLGEHGRGDVVRALAPDWDDLRRKGLARGGIEDNQAPMLRLLLAAQPTTANLDDVQTRLAVADAPEAPIGVLRCAHLVPDVLRGQRVRVHFQTSGVDYLLIEPNPLFGVSAALLNLSGGIRMGEFELLGDDGDIVFTMMDSQCQVFRQTLTLQLREPRTASRGWR